MGLYQMGQAALRETDSMNANGEWTGKDGIWSQVEFLSQPDIQTRAIRTYHNVIRCRYLPDFVKNSIGRVINGAHLIGYQRLTRYVVRQFGGY